LELIIININYQAWLGGGQEKLLDILVADLYYLD